MKIKTNIIFIIYIYILFKFWIHNECIYLLYIYDKIYIQLVYGLYYYCYYPCIRLYIKLK